VKENSCVKLGGVDLAMVVGTAKESPVWDQGQTRADRRREERWSTVDQGFL
jgi:hypothetical protein